MAEEGDIQVKVKTLIGESITVSISPTKTIHHLKLVLIQSFPPASISPHFHLFLRGKKLGLQSQIGSHSINPGEFIALMPFTKKGKYQNPDSQEFEAKSRTCHQNMQNLAESTWRDMMEDLSYLNKTSNCERETSPSGNVSDDIMNTSHINDETLARSYSSRKRRIPNCNCQEELSEDLITEILKCSGKDVLFEDICTRIFNVLETVQCLSDVKTGNCILLTKAGSQKRGQPPCLCICPPWLKIMMKVFTFLNILAGSLQVEQEAFTSDRVKDSLDKLQKLGLSASMDHVKHLSVICPKVLHLVEHDSGSELLHDVIVISNFQRQNRNEARECSRIAPRISESKMVACIKKRQTLFKTTLAKAFSLLMHKRKYGDGNAVSLEDLMTSMKRAGPLLHVVEPAQARFSSSNSKSQPMRCKKSQPMRCNETHALPPLEMLEHLRKGIGSNGQVVHVEEISPRVADFTEIPEALSESAKSSLVTLGISKLYKHQAESIKASLGGRNVVIATMTSSGKSLCYNLPVLEALSQNLLSCALYMFPTKALAQDQLRALFALTEKFEHLHIGVYDGDTSEADRNWLRANARLLITNPDMLHMSILPFHGQFQRILSNLKFVVIDEAHAYKGAFGCHTALILRRLRRLCSHVYGSDPSFVFSTATSANPREHAMELSNLPAVELIDKDGSPSGPKFFVLWNPPLRQEIVHKIETREKAFNVRQSSPILEISSLLAEMVQHGLRSIAFCKTRKLCELVLSYTREILHDTAPHLVNAICAYRAGYVAEDRRRIERELFSGKLCGVAATNALELGIDVGHIDVTLHLGFPGSVSSLWQQAGRSGRRGRPSLAVYVAFDGPLDQYFMKFPKKLFQSPIECCHVDAKNPKVLEQHLMCAAVEHPLSLIYDGEYFGSGLTDAIATLERMGYLSSDPSCDSVAGIWSYVGPEKSPHRTISIRAIESVRYKVIDGQTDEVLEEIEESRAFFQIYEGAVYMNQGKTYLVKDLNVADKTAVCQKAGLKYYTKTRDYTDIDVIGGHFAYPSRVSKDQFCRTTAQTNSCTVTTTWFGFHRIWKGSNTIFDTVDLSLPKYSYETQAVWIQVPQSVKKAVESANFSFRAGLHAASHAVLNAVPLYIICDSSDMAPECANPHEKRYTPERILIYDHHPGGTGLSARIRPLFNNLLSSALNMLTSCYCFGETGCPNCAHSLACKEYNELLHKDAAVMIIKGVLEAEESYFQELQAQGPLETT